MDSAQDKINGMFGCCSGFYSSKQNTSQLNSKDKRAEKPIESQIFKKIQENKLDNEDQDESVA